MATNVNIPEEYAWVLLTVLCMNLHYFVQSFAVGRLRKKLFSKAYFAKYFPQIKDSDLGYPDNGSGRYTSRWTDEEWFEFNNAQRVHQNYLEYLPVTIVLVLISGLVYPRIAVAMGGLLIIGRQMYARGYRKVGPKGRFPAMKYLLSAFVILLVASVLSILEIGGGLTGLRRFLYNKS